MDADDARPGARPAAHGRRPRRQARPPTSGRRAARVAIVVLAGLALASACAPRTTPVATNDVPVAQVTPGAARAAADVPGGTPAPRLSAGCDGATATAAPDRVVVAGTERAFLARIPSGPTGVPRDLVLAFHGRTNDAAQVRRYFGLDAALPDAIVVYPRALSAAPGTFAWTVPADPSDEQGDFALVDALIAAFGTAYCIDLERVFVVGHSLGAYFANDVACRFGDRIRAVASVAGGVTSGACTGGASALLVHHPEDRLVPVGEGLRARDAFRSANRLDAEPALPVEGGALAPLRCARHGDSSAAGVVVWCPRDDATTPRGGRDPHTWPAGMAAAIGAFFAGVP